MPQLTFSAAMRKIRQKNPEKIMEFLQSFQKNIQQAAEEKVDHPESAALLQTMEELQLIV